MPLSDQQRAFAAEFVKSGNATSAAKIAGYSEKTADVQGSQLLRKPLVAAEIARLTGRIEKKSALTAEKVVDALNKLVDFDPGQCFDDAGNLLTINKMPLEARKALAGVDLGKGSVKFSSRLGAIELAAKILQLVKQEQVSQQAVQIIIAPPAASGQVDVSIPVSQLRPEWD